MSRPALDVPHLDQWRATLRRSTADQYAPSVRGFFERRGDTDFASVGRDELIRSCAAIRAEKARSRTMSALDSFFQFLQEKYDVPHPAPNLARRVARELHEVGLRAEFERAGVPAASASALRWRDVARDLIGPGEPLPMRLENETRRRLFDDLLGRLQSASIDNVGEVLDARLIEI